MFVLLLVLDRVLFAFGFLHPVWWVAAAVLGLSASPATVAIAAEAGAAATVLEDQGLPGLSGVPGTSGPLGPPLQPPEPGALEARGPPGPRTPQMTPWDGPYLTPT